MSPVVSDEKEEKTIPHLPSVRGTGFETIIWELPSHVGHLAPYTYGY